MKAVIIVQGGLVQRVIADEDLEYLIVDQDVQDEDEATYLTDEAGTNYAAGITEYETFADPKTVKHFYDQIPAV